jgi:hypothetical protein
MKHDEQQPARSAAYFATHPADGGDDGLPPASAQDPWGQASRFVRDPRF